MLHSLRCAMFLAFGLVCCVGWHAPRSIVADTPKTDGLAKEFAVFADFLQALKDAKEGDKSLLDRTAVFYGSNMGNASAHICDNLPILLAGGGFKHAGHVTFDKKDNKQLSNLYVRLMQQMGVEADKFGSSTGTLTEVSGTAVDDFAVVSDTDSYAGSITLQRWVPSWGNSQGEVGSKTPAHPKRL